MFYKFLDLSAARNVYAVGDIHGEFGKLDNKLKEIGFDETCDHLLSVGDLTDRGPDSWRAIEFCEKPWFDWVRGNHEQLVRLASIGTLNSFHVENGGMWFKLLDRLDRDLIADVINDAPIALEVLLPDGRKVGVVHADMPTNDWNDIRTVADHEITHWTEYCLWQRDRINNDTNKSIVANIDHVYFGHTPKSEVFTKGNCSWIDTGACFEGGKLTVLKV